MSNLYAAFDLARFVINFVAGLRNGDTEWQKQKLNEIAELNKIKQIHKENLDHELNMLKCKHDGELLRLQESERRLFNDYKDYLDSLDEMKVQLLNTFTNMPKPLIHILHHHAKQIVDEMYKVNDRNSQVMIKARLSEFFKTIYSDTAKAIKCNGNYNLPEETLKLIERM